ncbi:MAG: FAD-binding oxidoreductase [Candidatus Bathyarchaeia archaeon]
MGMEEIFATVANYNGEEAKRVEGEMIKHAYRSYLMDESKLEGHASTLYFPKTELQISDFLKEMDRKGIPVTISGGRTGIVGGAVPFGGAVIILEGMNRITGLRKEDDFWAVRVQPGITLKEFREAVEDGKIKNYLDKSFNDWKALEEFLTEYRYYFYPPDPTEETATIGGTVATDASGARSYKYGSTRRYVRKLRIVLADGSVLAIERGVYRADHKFKIYGAGAGGYKRELTIAGLNIKGVKNVAGYFLEEGMDFIDLFIGSEGTLGVISEVELQLKRRPGKFASLLAFLNSEENALLFSSRLSQYQNIVSIEFFDNRSLLLLRKDENFPRNISVSPSTAAILTDFHYRNEEELEEMVERFGEDLEQYNLDLENTCLGVDKNEVERLHSIRRKLPQKINEEFARRKLEIPSLHKIGTDTAVPRSNIVHLLKSYRSLLLRSNLEHLIFGHIGEGHVHVNILPKKVNELNLARRVALELAKIAVMMNGSVSGEHGIGKLKRNLLKVMYDESQIRIMREIKKTMDPNLILSPGNIFPTDESDGYYF